jgi:hypothetical protein
MASLRVITFSSWIVLGICGFFSSVLTLVWLWVIPCALLVLCVFLRVRSKDCPSKRQWQLAALAGLVGFLGLQAAAHTVARGNYIAASSEWIELGQAPKNVVIIQPDRQIVGDQYGHTIREYLDEVGGFTVLRDDSAQTDLNMFDTLVFSGSIPQLDLGQFAGRIVWLNPPADVDDTTLKSLGEKALTIVAGSLGDWRRLRVWQSLVDEHPNWNLIALRGVADFIPNWPRYLKGESYD